MDIGFKIPDRFAAETLSAVSNFKAILLDGLSNGNLYFMVGDPPTPLFGYFLSRFLAKATALEHLRINFQHFKEDATEMFLSWLAEETNNSTGSLAATHVRLLF
jgi:hypothetical protein